MAKLLPYDQGKADYKKNRMSPGLNHPTTRVYADENDQSDYTFGWSTAQFQDSVGEHRWDRLPYVVQCPESEV